VKKSIPILCKVIAESNDYDILTDATWAISYLSDGDEEKVEMVM